VPDKWFEIADEAGLLIQNEFFIWTGRASWTGKHERKWGTAELIRQYKDWMREASEASSGLLLKTTTRFQYHLSPSPSRPPIWPI
jgi:hypothetical protein